jgi:CHAT domain-containing protein
MTDFFNNFHPINNFSKENYTGNLKNLLKEKGILHLFGHGELAINVEADTRNFQFSYQNNSKHKTLTKLAGNFKVNRDLVVLNNCFSGFPLFTENQFNKTIQLRIMSNGAKALISSPNKVDDYYSAELFKLFYAKIEAGTYYEDAFFEAKQTFFKEHPELSQPNYWNGLQLIQSYKVRNKSLKSNPAFVNWWLLSAFLDMLVMLLYVLLNKRLSFHHSIE